MRVSAKDSGNAAARRPAYLHGLENPIAGHAAADLLHHFPDGNAHGHFDQSAAANFSGQGEDLGAFARVVPSLANSAAPWRMIQGTRA